VIKNYTAVPEMQEPLPEWNDQYGSDSTTLQRLWSTSGAMKTFLFGN